MDEKVSVELDILLGVVEKEDGSEVAMMLSDALFDQFWKLRDVMKKSPDG